MTDKKMYVEYLEAITELEKAYKSWRRLKGSCSLCLIERKICSSLSNAEREWADVACSCCLWPLLYGNTCGHFDYKSHSFPERLHRLGEFKELLKTIFE